MSIFKKLAEKRARKKAGQELVKMGIRHMGRHQEGDYFIDVAERFDHRDFVAIVHGSLNGVNTILTTGCEGNTLAALEWAKEAIKHKCWIDGNYCPPDMYERNPDIFPMPCDKNGDK